MEAFNIEQKILNRQPKHVAYIFDAIGGALGGVKDTLFGTEGAGVQQSTGQLQSKEQRDALNFALKQSQDFKVRESKPFTDTSVLNQGAMQYNTPTARLSADNVSKVGYGGVNQEGVSIAGLDRLTSSDPTARLGGIASKLEAEAGTDPGFQAEMDASIKDAYEVLAKTRTKGKRELSGGGARYASATDEMDTKAYEAFGASVGSAIQQTKENEFAQRQQLTLEALKSAGDVTSKGLTLEQSAAEASAGIELQAYSKAADIGLSNVTNVINGLGTIAQNAITNAKAQVDAALRSNQLTAQEADNLNRLLLQKDAQYNQSVLANLSNLMSGATATTQENIVTQDQGKEGIAGDLIGAGASIATTKMMMTTCMPGTTEIDTWEGTIPIEDIQVGDEIPGYDATAVVVLQKHQYANPKWRKVYTVTFTDGVQIEVCDNHKIMDVPIKDLKESKYAEYVESLTYRTGVEVTYDILTSAPNGGYLIQGVAVNSMIPEMITEAIKLEKAA